MTEINLARKVYHAADTGTVAGDLPFVSEEIQVPAYTSQVRIAGEFSASTPANAELSVMLLLDLNTDEGEDAQSIGSETQTVTNSMVTTNARVTGQLHMNSVKFEIQSYSSLRVVVLSHQNLGANTFDIGVVFD